MRFHVLTTILAVLASGTAVAGLCLWLRERGMRPLAQFAAAWRDWSGGSRLHKALSLIALAALVSWAGAKPSGEIIESSNNRIIESGEAAEEDFDAKNAKGNNAKFAKTVGSRVPRDRDDLEGLVGRDVLGRPQGETGEAVKAALALQGQEGLEEREGLEAEYGLSGLTGGLALVSVGTNEVFDFSAPGGATVAEKWRRRGASKDFLRLNFADWSFPFGGESFSNLVVFAGGRVRLSRDAEICPFAANLGIVPEARWFLLDRINRIDRIEAVGDESLPLVGRDDLIAPQGEVSQFWHFLSPSNTLVLTWQNALLERETANTVSFQAELFRNGNAVFRYDLSRIGDEGLLTNAVVSAGRREGQERRQGLEKEDDNSANFSTFPLFHFSTSLTSLSFKTENELLCDEARAAFDDALGGLDPLSFSVGSTNTVWEHYVYAGTTNGAFALPSSTVSAAVLRVAVSGSGRGELLVGDRAVPLVGGAGEGEVSHGGTEARSGSFSLRASVAPCEASTQRQVLLQVPRWQTVPLYLRADATLLVSFSSDDFAFGVMPDPAANRLSGRINFPNATATTPCFHDYVARQTSVSLPAGEGADALACAWAGTASVAASNVPPRSAVLTGRFDGRTTATITYALSHPEYLFGRTTHSQTARFCPPPPDADDEETLSRYGDGGGEDAGKTCWHCAWGKCGQDCDCCASCRHGDDSSDDVPDEPDAEDYAVAVTNWPHLGGVLKIREPLRYDRSVFLAVPGGAAPRCCPCPGHATNHVAIVCRSSQLEVVDGGGRDFRSSTESTTVCIAGVSPSMSVGDAYVAFATNGAVCLDGKYTVLGVGVRKSGVDLALLNARSASFGLPVPATTNLLDAASLELVTEVGLPGWNVHIGFEGASAPFSLWVWDYALKDYRRLASSEDGGALDVSLSTWRKLVGGATDAATSRTAVRVTAEGPGAADLVFRYWNVIDGKFVEDEARQRLTAVDSPLRADVDRDGKIDVADAALSRAGRPFRFWTNPSSESRVGGEIGRLNLFPLAVDVTPFRRAWGNAASIRLKANGKALRYCLLDGVTAENASAVWTEDVQSADGVPLVDAELLPIPSEGLDVREMSAGEVLAVSAFSDVGFWTSPEIVVSLGEAEVFRSRLPMELHPVRKMYRYFSVRAVCGDTRTVDVRTGEPFGLPDGETDGRHFVFVHGYNVGPDAAREWADAMFKRLLLAGSRSMFTSVTWFGDYAQVWDGVPVVGGNSLNYYRNMQHAFLSAAPFKSVVDGLPGRKVLLAHSLGNVIVSSAIADHGLVDYERYHLLNAAVPMEAYDGKSQTDAMVDSAWLDVPQFRASRWHGLFAPPDFRAGLSWKGRFGIIPRAENCYSATEDVLANPVAGGMGNSWGIQELLKGTAVLYGTDLLLQNIAVEGGWGINARLVANPLAYVPGLGFRASYFEGYTREQAIAQPLFTSFDDTRMTSTNVLDFADVALRAKMLGDAIPAESFATGSNATDGFDNYEYLGNANHGWPTREREWRHSDIKNVAYRYVQDFFKHIKESTEQ